MTNIRLRIQQGMDALQRGRNFVTHDVWRIGMPGEPDPPGAIIRHVRVAILLVRNVVNDDLLLRASALTFATMLSIVPFLAIMFFMVRTLNIGETLSEVFLYVFGVEPMLAVDDQQHPMVALVMQVLQRGVPTASNMDNPVSMIVHFAASSSVPGSLTAATLIFLLSIVFGLMMNIESAFNTIWGLRRTRSWYRIFSDYTMILLVLPFLVVGVLGVTAVLERSEFVEKLGPLAVGLRGAPFLVTWLAFTSLYCFVPNTRVKWRYALLAGVISGTLWCLLSYAYVRYQFGLPRYSLLYSTFSQIPVLLMWTYCSWLVLLFGAELAFAYQNEPTFAMEQWAEGTSFAYRESLGLWTMIELGRRFDKGMPGICVEAAAREWHVPTRLLNDTLRQLEESKLAISCASNPPTYQPSRSLDKITVEDVKRSMREAGRDPSPLRENDSLLALNTRLVCGCETEKMSIADCLKLIDEK
jgi:membrane protein